MKYHQHQRAYRDAALQTVSRRAALQRMGAGIGSIGLAVQAGSLATAAALPETAGALGAASVGSSGSPLAPKPPHFPARAKRLIHLFMPGGPSQVDTFDYKPALAKHAGQRPALVDRKSLRNTKMGLMPSPFQFGQYGQCGKWVSDIFPRTAECVDDICFVHSMHTDIPEHAGAILMTNVGALQPNRPSMGAWLAYGLGAETENLPGFVAMSPVAQPRGKLANWGNAFLPGAYAGSYVNLQSMTPGAVLRDLKNSKISRIEQRQQADLLAQLNRVHLERVRQDQQL
ncbi:DUF1501 domain-containing protein, partial [Pirellulales bacterium]|nr:DUF1501 domain-containing protein [Pirellulales bacterium]